MKFFLIFFVLILVNSCSTSKKWESVKIDSELKFNPEFKKLDFQNELFDFDSWSKNDAIFKKSSDIHYTIEYPEFNEAVEAKTKCRSHFHKKKLVVYCGNNNGSGGEGFTISYQDKKFLIKEKGHTDVMILYEPKQEIILQSLILDKETYKEGDSIYGYVDFKIIRTDIENFVSIHEGKGYFRS